MYEATKYIETSFDRANASNFFIPQYAGLHFIPIILKLK